MSSRFVDWVSSILTAKTTSIDGTESIPIVNSTGTTQKATLANVIRYGGGSPRSTTAGNATVTQDTTGALWLEVAGQTAGNARGAGSFDWQAVRLNATYVASGENAVTLGKNCQASNQGAIAIGTGCIATGSGSVSLGYANSSYGMHAFSSGGVCSASGSYSFATGIRAVASNSCQAAFGNAPGSGQAQGNLQTFYTATTDATSTPLSITVTTTDRMVIPAIRACTFIGVVTAMCNVSSSSNFIKSWKIEGCITRDGSNTTRIVGTPTISVIAQDADGTPTPSTWAIASITADDTNESLAINVTGQAATTIRWQATLLYSQVGF